ncbi:hypothetical protein [Nocardia higoensis]|uniref:hypothetical protein n=1 Tax=Nocardia higoensis TaxID=228599 RepID=UPI0012F6AD33|nr:hypothetical protein [Nocardia higoensis]
MTDNELTARQRGERELARRGWLTPEDTDRDETGTGTGTEDSPRARGRTAPTGTPSESVAKALRWLQRNGKTFG